MQVSVEKVSDLKRRLTVTLPLDKIEAAYHSKINEYAKQANIKGFRPGKAPLSFIQQRFGQEARKEALGQVLQAEVDQALTQAKLRPVSVPHVEPKPTQPNQPLEFIVSFEVFPEIESIKCVIPSVEKLKVDITEQDIKYVVDQLLKQHTKWKVVERVAQNKDRVVVDYYAIFEGKEDLDNKIQSFPIELGSAVMIPGFEDGLIGSKAGDEVKLNLHFPEDFNLQEKAGKPVDFIIQVKQVFEAHAPELNETFIQKLGIESGKQEDLQQQIKQTLELERNRVVKEKLKEQVFEQLLEQNPIEVPSSLIEHEAKSIHDEVYQHQQHDHHKHAPEEMARFNEIAKKRLALSLLITEYAKKSELKIDEIRVIERINEIALSYESPQKVIDWLSSNPEKFSGIQAMIMEEQVLDKLLEGVTVTEKVMSYADMKGMPS